MNDAQPNSLPGALLLRPPQAAAYLKRLVGVGSPSSLAKARVLGTGPKFYKVGPKLVAYATADLDAWVADRLSPRTSTARNPT